MGIFSTKKEGKGSLGEIKNLTMGADKKENEKKTTQNQVSSSVDKDVVLFKEQQKATGTQTTQTSEQGKEKTWAFKEKKEPSALEKLRTFSTDLKENPNSKTITTQNFSKPVVSQPAPEKVAPVGMGFELKKSDGEPKIIQEKNVVSGPETKTTTPNKTEEKDPFFDWMRQATIETPLADDFNEQKETIDLTTTIVTKTPTSTGVGTPIDELFKTLEAHPLLDTGKLAELSGMTPESIEQIAKLFEEDGVIEIEYPASLTKKPTLKLKSPVTTKINKVPKGNILEEYPLEVDFVPVKIKIVLVAGEARPVYAVELPSIGKYTLRFLQYIKDEVAENMPIDLEEIVDPKKSKKLKERFFYELNSHMTKYFQTTRKETINMLSGILLHEMYGLGTIELIMGDDMLEEVSINSSKTPITVYHRVHGWLKTNLLPGTEEDINNLSSQIGRKIGKEITILNPILDAHLLSGDRVNATLFPVSAEGNTITIRRFARKPWTIIDFIGTAHTMNSEMAATLWLAMQYELNIVIAGGTASGKTSALNSMLALVPTYHRIITIEDVREIVLPKYLEWNWVPMITRATNPEGLGEVTMLELMVTSLRMRPDRIIVGEIRRKKEAEVLMEAIETGHSIYSTIHANSAYQVLRRLAEPPINIPLMQIELIDLIVVQYRDRKTNKRRTYEIAEIEQTSTGQGLQVNTIYKWNPRTDGWERLNKPIKLITLLNLHTGLTEEEIGREIADRQEILEWMQRQNITELDIIGFLVKLYYSDADKIRKMAKQNTPFAKIRELLDDENKENDENAPTVA